MNYDKEINTPLYACIDYHWRVPIAGQCQKHLLHAVCNSINSKIFFFFHFWLSLLSHRCFCKWFETARQYNWKLELWIIYYIITYFTLIVNHIICFKQHLQHILSGKKLCFCFYLKKKIISKGQIFTNVPRRTHIPAWESLT